MSTILYNGDCLDIMQDIPDKSIDAIICDLPYGTTNNKWDIIIPLESLWMAYNRIIKDGGAIVLTSSQPFTSILVMSNIKNFKYEWIWRKTISSGSMNAKIMPLKQHESVLVFSGNSKTKVTYYPKMTKGTPYKTSPAKFAASNYGEQERPAIVNDGTRYPTSVIDVANPRVKGGHPTQKPVELMEYLVETYTLPGDTILDNCMGSGATGVACVQHNRQFVGMELDEKYYNFAETRIKEALELKTNQDKTSLKKDNLVNDLLGDYD